MKDKKLRQFFGIADTGEKWNGLGATVDGEWGCFMEWAKRLQERIEKLEREKEDAVKDRK